jgi:hypothetical protein
MTDTPTPGQTPYHTLEIKDRTYRFRKPRLPELDAIGSRAKKSSVTASIEFSKSIVWDDDKADWARLTDDMPGKAAEVVSEVFEKLGFPKPD